MDSSDEDIHDDLVDFAIVGASHMADGLTDFTSWSKAMLAEEYAESVRPFLPVIFDNSKKMLERTKSACEAAEQGRDKTATPIAVETRRSMPELIAQMRQRRIAETNKGITHAEFVAGTRSGTIGFTCMIGEPYQLIRGGRRTFFMIFVLLYMAAPIVLVPFWAWHEHDWWLLLGIVASAVGTGVATRLIYKQDKQYSIGASLVVASLVSWLTFGIHSRYTFFALCALWGLMLFMIADEAEREYAMQSLVEDSNLFEQAVAQNKIMIVRKHDPST